jgi:hypothetical protein
MPQVDSGLIRAVAVVLAAALSWGGRAPAAPPPGGGGLAAVCLGCSKATGRFRRMGESQHGPRCPGTCRSHSANGISGRSRKRGILGLGICRRGNSRGGTGHGPQGRIG